MNQPTATEISEPAVVFRSSKKRKQFRQRAEESEPKADDATTQPLAPAPTTEHRDVRLDERTDTDGPETDGLSVAEALRLRNARKSRPKGVEFRAEGPAREEEMTEAPSQAPKDELAEALELGMGRRFAPPAGLVGELVNKHM